MVENVSGLTLGQYLAQNLTGPLGMADTAFNPTEDMLGRLAAIHARLADGSLIPIEVHDARRPPIRDGGAEASSAP